MHLFQTRQALDQQQLQHVCGHPARNFGMLVGGWFPDATASEAIKHVNRFPSLLRSSTFVDLYWKLLHAVVKWSKDNIQYTSPELIQEVEVEVAIEKARNQGQSSTPQLIK